MGLDKLTRGLTMHLTLAQKTGQQAENIACQYLQKQGCRLVTRNYLCKVGEIDLIMQDKAYLVFVEVRYRHVSAYGSGIESITKSKQSKLIKAANYYLQKNALLNKINCRFDIVAVDETSTIKWLKNAF